MFQCFKSMLTAKDFISVFVFPGSPSWDGLVREELELLNPFGCCGRIFSQFDPRHRTAERRSIFDVGAGGNEGAAEARGLCSERGDHLEMAHVEWGKRGNPYLL